MGNPNLPRFKELTAGWNRDDVLKAIKVIEEALKTDQGNAAHSENALTSRERLIQRAFEMSDAEIEAVLDYIDHLEDLKDIAVSESRKDEVGIPLDDALKQLGYTREELMDAAKAEGIVQ